MVASDRLSRCGRDCKRRLKAAGSDAPDAPHRVTTRNSTGCGQSVEALAADHGILKPRIGQPELIEAMVERARDSDTQFAHVGEVGKAKLTWVCRKIPVDRPPGADPRLQCANGCRRRVQDGRNIASKILTSGTPVFSIGTISVSNTLAK